jgi:hypothetical protein
MLRPAENYHAPGLRYFQQTATGIGIRFAVENHVLVRLFLPARLRPTEAATRLRQPTAAKEWCAVYALRRRRIEPG